MEHKYFKNKRVLITGITGFIGSRLAKKLDSLGASVFGISRSKSDKSIYKINILNRTAIDKLFKKLGIQICFHLAGKSIVEMGQSNPYDTFTVNTQGTLNVLECIRKYKSQKIIIASTSHVYGNNKIPFLEEYTPKPSRPYETSKAITDLIAQSYAETFNLPIYVPRFVNIYGPGDLNFTRLIPKTIKDVILSRSPRMWGGKTQRSFLYIDDAVDAYIKLACQKGTNESNLIFNFGSPDIITVEDLIKKIVSVSGKKLPIKRVNKGRGLEIKSQYVSWEKARKILGWYPKVSLDEGIKKTFLWYNDFLKTDD